jgi:hypothetical protein
MSRTWQYGTVSPGLRTWHVSLGLDPDPLAFESAEQALAAVGRDGWEAYAVGPNLVYHLKREIQS